MSYYVYILESLKDKTYYVGSTNNLKDRIERHNQGRVSYTYTVVHGSWSIAKNNRTGQDLPNVRLKLKRISTEASLKL